MLMQRPIGRLIMWLWVAPLWVVGSAWAQLPDFTELAAANGPAVVNISTSQKEGNHARLPHGLELPELPESGPWGDLLRRFFGERHGEGKQLPDEKGDDLIESRSLGSGFIIDAAGYILTNRHVIADADEIVVRLSDRRELVAEVVGSDRRSDIALLKVEAEQLPVVKLGDDADLKVGEWVMAIGSPFGFDHSVSVGVVSALGRALPSESYVPFIQTDVAINPGNSGGPLFDLNGKVVGINSQIYSRTGGFMGLAFAIPISVAMDVVAQLKAQGYVQRGWLGVLIQNVTRELAESFGMRHPSGALVAQVLEKSPAAAAGLEVGDVILSFDGQPIQDSSDLPPLVGRTPVGEEVVLQILRRGSEQSLRLTIGELPAEEELAQGRGETVERGISRLGLQIAPLETEQQQQLGIDGGVIVTEVRGGAAQQAGVRQGDVVLQIDGVAVEDVAQFRRLVEALPAGRTVPLLIQRDRGPIFLALRVPE